MQVMCKRDNTTFEAILVLYPSAERPTKEQNRVADQFIECPTCHRRYFLKDDGTWESDRKLVLLSQGT